MNKFKTLGLQDIIRWGKHKGEQIEDLIYDDPNYITWLASENIVEFDEEATKLMEVRKLI